MFRPSRNPRPQSYTLMSCQIASGSRPLMTIMIENQSPRRARINPELREDIAGKTNQIRLLSSYLFRIIVACISTRICIYIYMYVCMHVCMLVRMHVCMDVCLSVCLLACLPACPPACLSVRLAMYICMQLCTYVQGTHACFYSCLYECMYACTYNVSCCVKQRTANAVNDANDTQISMSVCTPDRILEQCAASDPQFSHARPPIQNPKLNCLFRFRKNLLGRRPEQIVKSCGEPPGFPFIPRTSAVWGFCTER